MARPGDHIGLWIIIAAALVGVAHVPLWTFIPGAFAIGWLYNERVRRNA
jgi:hypothetical protein